MTERNDSSHSLHAFYQRLFRQNERVMKLGLQAITAALAREPHIDYPLAVVAGTNGKGQVSALLSNAFQSAGMRTGLYTSPHLCDFRERIRIGGRMIDTNDVALIGAQVLAEYGGDDVPQFSGIALTYFECCLIMALRAFQKNSIDFGIFEVGLGGRLDAVNGLSPDLCIITSIGLDHMQYLGNTPEQIAREKAGIMRENVPVICGRTQTQTLKYEAIYHRCASFDALGESFDWQVENDNFILKTKQYGEFSIDVARHTPAYQCDNIAVAAFALLKAFERKQLKGDITSIVKHFVRHTQWVGRMWDGSRNASEKIGVAKITLDGAHNIDAVKSFVRAVLAQNHASRALIVNSCADKAIEAMFPHYLDAFDAARIFIAPIASTPRGCHPEAYCSRVGLSHRQACRSLHEALCRAAHDVAENGVIYISGSLYLIGDALRELQETSALESVYVP